MTLSFIRSLLTQHEANYYYVRVNDPHLSEYIPEHYEIVRWLTGFTGSNAVCLIGLTSAYLWTDSRYWEQAAQQLPEGITLMRWGDKECPTPTQFLEQLNRPKVLLHAALVSAQQHSELSELTSALIDLDDSILDEAWPERAPLRINPLFPHTFSEVAPREKLQKVRRVFQALPETLKKPAALVVSKLDEIAWLTNLRGSDIDFNPVFLSHLIVTEASTRLFIHRCALTDAIEKTLADNGFEVDAYENFLPYLKSLAQTHTCLADFDLTNAQTALYCRPFDTPIARLKAVKTPKEIDGLRLAMKRDGEAIENFIDELKRRLGEGEALTENDAVDILHQHRLRQKNFITESFATIAAVNANAALPHYEPLPGCGSPIMPPCVLLVDSGGHYHEGTTDTTRVWFLGDPREMDPNDLAQLKKDYRAVYEGMQALKNARFKIGTCGHELDPIARAPIQAIGIDYGHGTGHGIGLTLNVHETPPNISPRQSKGSLTPFAPGMVVSDEPGIYRPGRWGIRIENTLVCVKMDEQTLGFECLTQCKIDETLL